jgi:sugar phosphate permease
LALAGIFVGLAELSGTKSCIAALILGLIFFGATSSNIWAVTQTLAGPRAAGRWTGFQNFVGNLAGIVAPSLTGFVLERSGHFSWAFVIVTGVALLGTVSWVFIVGPVEPVIWDRKLRASAALAHGSN